MAYGTPRELYLSRLAAGLGEKHAGSSGARLCKVYGAPVEFQRFAKRQGSAHKPPLQRCSERATNNGAASKLHTVARRRRLDHLNHRACWSTQREREGERAR